MANAEKGEVSFPINGKTYTLALTLNAMVSLEELFSTPGHDARFVDIAALAEAGSTKHVRALLWALFQEYHADEVKEPADAGRLVHKAGGIVALSATLSKVMEMAAPDRRDVAALGVKDPQGARADAKRRAPGTGEKSISVLDAPA